MPLRKLASALLSRGVLSVGWYSISSGQVLLVVGLALASVSRDDPAAGVVVVARDDTYIRGDPPRRTEPGLETVPHLGSKARLRLVGLALVKGFRPPAWPRGSTTRPSCFPDLAASDGLGDGADATDELVLGEVAEGEEQCWLSRSVREPVVTQPGDADPQGSRRLHDSVLVDLEGEQEHGVATGGESLEAIRNRRRWPPPRPGRRGGRGRGRAPSAGAGRTAPTRRGGPAPPGRARVRPDYSSCFSSVRTSTKRGGARTQPIRIAGASVLLTDPRANTRSGSSP